MTSDVQTASKPQALWKSATIFASGNFLEMYDFMVFGFYATIIAAMHFAGANEYATLIGTQGGRAFGYRGRSDRRVTAHVPREAPV